MKEPEIDDIEQIVPIIRILLDTTLNTKDCMKKIQEVLQDKQKLNSQQQHEEKKHS